MAADPKVAGLFRRVGAAVGRAPARLLPPGCREKANRDAYGEFSSFTEEGGRRVATGLRATDTEKPFAAALRRRDRGCDSCRVAFDAKAEARVALVFGRKHKLRVRTP
jgi:hypothetical protein